MSTKRKSKQLKSSNRKFSLLLSLETLYLLENGQFCEVVGENVFADDAGVAPIGHCGIHTGRVERVHHGAVRHQGNHIGKGLLLSQFLIFRKFVKNPDWCFFSDPALSFHWINYEKITLFGP